MGVGSTKIMVQGLGFRGLGFRVLLGMFLLGHGPSDILRWGKCPRCWASSAALLSVHNFPK